MIGKPGLRLEISPANAFEAQGPLAGRVEAVVRDYCARACQSVAPRCRVNVLQAPPEHVGLGTGTQLALSVVAGLNAWLGHSDLGAEVLVRLASRAARSSVGSHGFLHGGLVFESGKLASDTLAPLERRVSLPAEWRFVLIIPRHQHGISGDAECRAFRELPPVPAETTVRLLGELRDEMLPAARNCQFDRFSESLYRYGHLAGMCFAAKQLGPYASPRVTEMVETIRSLGVRGVGQSSWGPTVFALLESPTYAERFVNQMRHAFHHEDELIIAEPNNSGATITRRSQS